MNRLLCLLLLLLHASKAINIWAQDLEGEEEEEFIKDCQTNSTCGGIDVRYPFRLNSTPVYCGVQGLEVSCSAAGDAIITLPDLGPCKVSSMSIYSVRIKLEGDEWARSPLQKLFSANLTVSIQGSYTLVRCPSEITTDPRWIDGPIPCLSNGSRGQFVYQMVAWAFMDLLPSQCEGAESYVGRIIYASGRTFRDEVQGCTQTLQMDLSLIYPGWENCLECDGEGKLCGSRGNQTACLITARRHGTTTNIGLIVDKGKEKLQ